MKYVQNVIRSLQVNKDSLVQVERSRDSKSVGAKSNRSFKACALVNLTLSFRRRIGCALPVVGLVSL